MHGILNLDKPPGISSARAVGRVKWLLPRGTKIGHAGTLDPFATGVLLLLIGRGTKSCESLMGAPKEYETTVRLGGTTATDDLESPEIAWSGPLSPVLRGQGGGEGSNDETGRGLALTSHPSPHPSPLGTGERGQENPTREAIEHLLPRFVGPILQRPPAFSAMKVGGRRAYDLARKGHEVKLEPRTVQVYGIELLSYEWPNLSLRINCGRGTYIRSIARDLGAALNVGGYLTVLRRTRIGDHRIDTAVTLERLSADGVAPHLIPLPSA